MNAANTGFMLIAAALVMLMTPGLAFFYGGLVGRSNTLTIMIQSFASLAITTVLWWAVGSQANPTAVRQAVAAGAAGFVPKRASERELVEAIRRVAAGGRYVDPDLGAQLVVPDALPELEPLTDRERDVFTLLALGYTNQEIANRLFISVRTVNSHRTHVMQKLRLETRAELVLLALSSGVVGGAG
jgi:DNA-binding NarL/FixJ family response regulator